ncbi:tRNA (adenosine(37)-N6)-dimethylallyltransferase MiaA [Carnobacterium gallinarum]|uniref:tRNA (adenosine(37)-N6)-dimethylallyltransferase MiaA n=1 Tax=Carnobacterium gallinarum TaxID=2749 RepID=UPI000551D5C7|nr:tRNA (adenosine(37)-N6)-dimethylallyltransferase MiaA [Carnobacterium gallinarum]
MKEKIKVIIIVGPTAVGKTSLSIAMAKAVDGEIISGDSMQVYRNLSIGTAKATLEEQDGVPHHLIDCVDVDESYSVSDFQKMARHEIAEIGKRGKVPIIVGGTGLYIEALLYDLSFGGTGEEDLVFREAKEALAKLKGPDFLWRELEAVDPVAAKGIHPNNVKRVIRALEVYHVTGKRFSDFQHEHQTKEAFYEAKIIGLTTEREKLYQRINQRVEIMLENGLLEEAEWLCQQNIPNAQAALGIGYKEIMPYLQQKITLDQAIEQIQQNSRRYAKRQLTWFRNRWAEVEWWDLVQNPKEQENVISDAKRFLQK